MIKVIFKCCMCPKKAEPSYSPADMGDFSWMIARDLTRNKFLTSETKVYCEKCAKDKKRDHFGSVID